MNFNPCSFIIVFLTNLVKIVSLRAAEMKKLHTYFKLGLIGAAAVATTSSASAQVNTLLGGVSEGLSGEISAGYDSEYFYRGLWFGADNAWTGIDFEKALCDGVTLSLGAYYLDTLNSGPYSESGISSSIAWDSGVGTFEAGFTHFRFFDGFDGGGIGQQDATEFSLGYSTNDFYGFSGYVQGVWDVRIDAGYLEAGIAQSFDFGFASLDLSAALGYSIGDYYVADTDDEDDLTHVLVTAALPIQLLENVTFTPHVSANISLGARENANNDLGQDDFEVFGGASFAVSF